MNPRVVFKFVLIITLSSIGLCFGAGMQRYAVKGKLLCGARVMANTQVKLVDTDKLRYDDVLDTTHSDENGEFFLAGQSDEFTRIDPVLKIYHDCSDGLPCQRRWKMALPKSYISKPGEANPKTFDIGVFNLEINTRKETRKCITG